MYAQESDVNSAGLYIYLIISQDLIKKNVRVKTTVRGS